MKPAEYIDAAKAQLKMHSDYELAKYCGIGNGPLAQMRKGARPMTLELTYKLAIILEKDPAQVVAELEEQREKNPKKRAFWTSFTSRAKSGTALILCTLALAFSVTCGHQTGPVAGFFRRMNRA